MDSANENFAISSKQSLLGKYHHQQISPPKHTKNNNLKSIFLIILVLVILILGSIILSSIYKKRQSKPLDRYKTGSIQFYCHLTVYPDLCYDSMSSIINTTILESSPNPIFSTTLQISISGLNNISISITKGLSSTASNSLAGPSLSKCNTWVHDSMSRLNKTLSMLGVDSDIEWLTYYEMDDMKAWVVAAADKAFKCLLTLEDVVMMVDGEERLRVEEVKLGVEKARKYMMNSIGLWDKRDSILYDFYNRFNEYDDGFYYYQSHIFDYGTLIWFNSALYLFMVLLYFMVWRSK